MEVQTPPDLAETQNRPSPAAHAHRPETADCADGIRRDNHASDRNLISPPKLNRGGRYQPRPEPGEVTPARKTRRRLNLDPHDGDSLLDDHSEPLTVDNSDTYALDLCGHAAHAAAEAAEAAEMARFRPLLQHMTGTIPSNAKKTHGFRNYFCADLDSDAYADFCRMEERGLVFRGTPGNRSRSLYFYATKAGCELIGMHKAAIKRATGAHPRPRK